MRDTECMKKARYPSTTPLTLEKLLNFTKELGAKPSAEDQHDYDVWFLGHSNRLLVGSRYKLIMKNQE